MKMLIAVDGSKSDLRTAGYVADIAARDWDMTLYHVRVIPSPLREHGGSESPEKEERIEQTLDTDLERWEKRERERCERDVFEPALRLFAKRSDDCRVRTEVSFVFQGDAALDIIEKVRVGKYDTVVMGRHGMSALREFLLGSVTFKVVHHLRGSAVWIVE